MENLENPIPITLDGLDATLDVSSDLSQLKSIRAQISEITNKMWIVNFKPQIVSLSAQVILPTPLRNIHIPV